MVRNDQSDESRSGRHATRELDVIRAGRRITRRVVVREDQAVGVREKRRDQNLAGIYVRRVQGAPAHDVPAQDVEPRAQKDDPEHLARLVGEEGREERGGIVGSGEPAGESGGTWDGAVDERKFFDPQQADLLSQWYWPRKGCSDAAASIWRTGSSSLNAPVNAFESDHMFRGSKSGRFGAK